MSGTLVLLFAVIASYIWNVFITMRLDSKERDFDMLEDEMAEEIKSLTESIKELKGTNRMLAEKLYTYIDINNKRVTDVEDLSTGTDNCLMEHLGMIKSLTNVTSASVPYTNT